MAAAPAGRFCPRCGTTNPPDYAYCGRCHQPLPVGGEGASPPPPSGPPTVPGPFAAGSGWTATVDIGRGTASLLLLWIGVAVLVVGLMMVVGAAIEHQGVTDFNNACSKNPVCTPSSDPSGAFLLGGGILLVLGVVIAAVGGAQYARRYG